MTHYPKYPMNLTTDSQALLTKTFLYFIPFFFFFFVFSPVNCLCPTATPHHFSLFPIIMSTYRSTISTLFIYHFISFIYIMQGSSQQEPHSHRLTKPKTQNKKKNTNSSESVQTSAVQPHNTSTKSVKLLKEKIHKSQAQIGKR